jgi:hypothetical protein
VIVVDDDKFAAVEPAHPQQVPAAAQVVATHLSDITGLERVKFVMNGGQVIRNDLK